ncbi:MAG: hypothetical protein R6V62_07555 [Candidatus Fermentibacteraceae bacterium]
MTSKDALKQMLATWLSVHGEDAASPPSVSVPALPVVQPELLSTGPATTAALSALPLFKAHGELTLLAASLLAGMDTEAAGSVFRIFKHMASPSINARLTRDWFAALHLLPRNLWRLGVDGYANLAATFPESGKPSGIIDLAHALSCWFRVLRSSSDGNLGEDAAAFCLELARTLPGHFPYHCDRLSAGGEEVHEALKKAMSFPGVTENNRAVLMDFAADLGWLYPGEEFAPIWEIVARRGMPIYRRIAEGMAPIGSLRFYCGAMRALKKHRGIAEFLSEERVHRAMVLFRTDDPGIVTAVLNSSPVACSHLDSQMEIDLAVELLSIRLSGSENPFKLGELFIEMVDTAQKGITYQGLVKFLSGMQGRIEGEPLVFVNSYLSDAGEGCSYTAVDVMRLYRITERVLSAGRTPDRKSLRTVFRALDGAPSGRKGLVLLERAMIGSGSHQLHLAAVASLLVRMAPDDDAAAYLHRTRSIADVFALLTPVDRGKLSSGLAPAWMEKLLDEQPEAGKTVIQFLGRVEDPSRRLRFLEMVVTPLMQEVSASEPLFRDCLSFAVTGYNSAPEQDRLREAENLTLQRVFRAGGRVAALDLLMQDFLTLPGLSRQRSEELLSGIRAVCDRFSRQAVWLEGFDAIFSSFLDQGIRRILNAFMEVPDALETVNSPFIARLADKLMPVRVSGAGVSTGAGRSAMAFFTEVLPESVFFYHRQIGSLAGFLENAIGLAQRSIGGIPAGDDFLLHLASEVQQSRAFELSTGLEAWLLGSPAPTTETDHFNPEDILSSWSGIHEAREIPRKRIGGVTALLTSSGARREEIIRICSILSAGMSASSIPGGESLSYHCDREALMKLKTLLGDRRDPLDFFMELRRGRPSAGDEKAVSELSEAALHTGADPVQAWTARTLPPILNCALMILMAEPTDSEKALQTARAIVEVVEFLGADDASELLLMVAGSLSSAVFPGQSTDLLERQLFGPIWKMRALDRIELLLAGRNQRRRLLDLLLGRLLLESGTPERASFVRKYGTMFVCVWGYILENPFPNAESILAAALRDSWVFSGGAGAPQYPAALQEINDLVRDEVRKQRHAHGVVTDEEAREISADMRRKYRDNADSVAILLRWTVDPSREDLLRLLEENEKLLQAVSADQELLHLLDMFGNRKDIMEKAAALAGDPMKLKKSLSAVSRRKDG